MQFTMRIGVLQGAVGALLATVLVACGGGGGGDSGGGAGTLTAPSAPVAVTATNAPAVAATAISGVANVIASGGLVAADTSATAVPPRSISRITVDAVKRAQDYLSAPQTVTGAVQTFSCAVSGNVTITDSATSLVMTFNNCSDYVGEMINGTLSITGITGTSTSFSGSFSADLTIVDTGYPTIQIVGGYNFSVTYSGSDYTSTVAGTSFSVIDGTNVTTLSNFDFSESYTASTSLYSATANYTLAATEIGGSVTVQTLSPVQQYAYRFYPFAGQLQATGTGNSRVRVTILGDETHAGNDVNIEVDADGNGSYETTISHDWSTL
jgi:hypothetical protein